jgi:hypothetical protein
MVISPSIVLDPETVKAEEIVVMFGSPSVQVIYGRISLHELIGVLPKVRDFPAWTIRSEEIVVVTWLSSHIIYGRLIPGRYCDRSVHWVMG